MSEYSLKRFANRCLKLECKVAQHYRLFFKDLLAPHLHQVIIGLLLSDGSIERPSKTGAARLCATLGFTTLPYLMHLYNLFEPYTDSGVTVVQVKNNSTNKAHDTVRFKTAMVPVFVNYHSMFYTWDKDKERYVKIVPLDIENLMTPVVLAHLIMGDGNLKKGDNIIRVYTNSFTKTEVEKLASAITVKLGIVAKAAHDRNGQYMITISKSQINKVMFLIGPHMHPSMLYKLGIVNGKKEFDYSSILGEI